MFGILGLFASFSKKGIFWVPDCPTSKIPGELTFNHNDGLSLELYGVLDSKSVKRGIIFGAVEGKCWTLYKTYVVETRHHSDSAGHQSNSRCEASYAFVGAHIDPASATFGELGVHFTKMEEWVHHSAFTYVKSPNDSGTLAKFDPYPTPSVYVPTLNARVNFGYIYSQQGASFAEMKWSAKVFFKVEPENPQPFFDFLFGVTTTLRQLMALFIGAPVFPTSIQLKYGDQEVEFLQESPDAKENPNFRFTDMIVLYPKLADIWESVLVNWFARSEALDSAKVLLFGSLYSRHPVELDFLTLMHAIEAFHRAHTNATYVTEDDYRTQVYEPMVMAIPSGVASSLRSSLKNKLKYGNEFSLRKRLSLLFKSLPPELLTLVKFDAPDLIATLVDNRNYLTHYTEELKEKRVPILKMWQLAQGIQTVMFYLLYQIAGIPDDRFLTKLMSKRRFIFHQPE